MKRLIVWLLKYLLKHFKIEVVDGYLAYDVFSIYVYKDKICMVIDNRRIIERD